MTIPKHDSIQLRTIDTDLLVIGGGTAGCLAAVEARERYPELSVLVIDKAHIDRSGCLAAGMNAINAFINPGRTVEDWVRYVKEDANGVVREDLIRSQAALFAECVARVESWGLPIPRDEKGRYVTRGRWNIRIHGESLKPILAAQVKGSGARVMNRVSALDFIVEDGEVLGATAIDARTQTFYVIRAAATIIATGGAAGLYRPNNPHSARGMTWYSPYNQGAGYAMGIRAGAEMTTFEMRYIAQRTKDVIAPTGTVALGAEAGYRNALGEPFMKLRWAAWGGDRAPTPIRTFAPLREMKEGRGPLFLDTTHLDPAGVRRLKEAFLDMYPNQVLYWVANGIDPSREGIEIQMTEPYLVGGHCAAGYWVDTDRATTLPGLWAAGDVAGGAPKKFVSGAWAEGTIAARAAGAYAARRRNGRGPAPVDPAGAARGLEEAFAPWLRHDAHSRARVGPYDFELRLQKIMDEYAGGASTFYEMSEARLLVARRLLDRLPADLGDIQAVDQHELVQTHELRNRVAVARVLVEHLIARRETRWPGFQTRTDFPERDDARWLVFVNSRTDTEGRTAIVSRPVGNEDAEAPAEENGGADEARKVAAHAHPH